MRSIQRDPRQSVESGACTGARLLYLYGALVMAGSLHISFSRGFCAKGGDLSPLAGGARAQGREQGWALITKTVHE